MEGLRHCVGIFPAVFQSFKAQVSAVHRRILRTLSGVISANLCARFRGKYYTIVQGSNRAGAIFICCSRS
jgi:hypothetical protein